ncbi:MAG TPA: ATP-binding protein [Polyangiaceae bacterium]|nr:ATP-binding protein [Polyangiaceae bacterium]
MSRPIEDKELSTVPPGSGMVPAAIGEVDRLRVLDHLSGGIAVCHADAFLYVNAALVKMLGHESQEALTGVHRVSEIVGAPSFEAWAEASSREASQQSWRRADGVCVRVDVTLTPMTIGGQSVRVALVRDVTAAWHAQAQRQQTERLATVGSLAAGVAHQLNNPLAYVVANLDFLTEALPAFLLETTSGGLDDLLDAMADAREGAERVARIVRDLHAFSRVEDEPRELVDVHTLLDSACASVDGELKERGKLIKVYEQVSPVEASPSRLAQVFSNILFNAVQAIPEGAASRNEVTVHTYNDDQEGVVVIEIRDTGVGMSPAVKARIFDPFYTLKPSGEGTGLGLTACLAIVHGQGGRILVDSDEGRGSTFRVQLPAAAATGRRNVVSGFAPKPAARPPRILIVDDEATLLASLKRALSRDMDVVLAESAAETLELLEKDQRFDAILCDIMMPDVTGIDLFEQIAKTHPELAERFVFMTTGAASPGVRQFLDGVGLPRLHKPFDLGELQRLVQLRAEAEAGGAR